MNIAREPITVSISVLEQMFLYLNALNVDIDSFLRQIEIDPAYVRQPDTQIPIETYLHIQDSAAEFTQDACFGLHMGEFAQAGSWSILGYLMMNCRTLGEAFEKSGRYMRIIGNLIEAHPQLRFNKIKVNFSTPPHAPQMSRHCFESTLASSVRMMRSLTGQPLSPLEVTFIYPQPANPAEYERVFRCPVRFAQPTTSFTIDWKILNTPVCMANPGLLAYFENYAQQFLAARQPAAPVTAEVTRIILAHLDNDGLTIGKVARELSMSVRTLQNRLDDEGVVFSDLLKDIRERLAKQYLREDYTVEQITYLLGFSEPAAFRKAFKKWAGLTPREYRDQFSVLPGAD